MRKFGGLMRDIWYLSGPYFRSEEKWSAWGLLLLVLAADLLLVRISVLINLNGGAWVNALQSYDAKAFFNLLFLWETGEEGPFGIIPGFVPLVVLAVLIVVNGRYMRQWLQIRWRRWLTARYQAEWLAKQAYYRLQLQPPTLGNDNPDQRISDDVRDFVETGLVLGFGFITNIFSMFSFLAILWELSFPIEIWGVTIPAYLVWVALFYAVVGTWLVHLVGRPLVPLNFARQRLEADYRFALVRLRENAEGVALYSGERDEAQVLDGRFGAIVGNFRQLMRRNRFLNAFTYSFDEVASIFPWFAATPLYFSKKITFGNLSRVAGAFGEVQQAASWIVTNYATLADWASTVERLATFRRSLDAVHALGDGRYVVTASAGPTMAVDDLRLALPDGSVLLDLAALRFEPGVSTAITGRSGGGKSTLFRALAGIWPFGSGRVTRPAGSALFLPQKPYIPLGTLRRALCYPAAEGAYTQETVTGALEDAGLGHLAAELDLDAVWAQRLSGGEQQRLALARALLARPDWLFLDEATASLDPEGQADLYRILKQRLPGTGIVSIAHAPDVVALHDRHLVLRQGPEGGTLARSSMMRGVWVVALLLVFPLAGARAQQDVRHAGIARITVAAAVPFDALVWYPTDDDDVTWKVGPFALPATHDASVAEGRFPIVLLSHGGGSSGGSPMVLGDISAALARNGFIVIAPFHGNRAPALRLRPPQMVQALTAVLADKRFKAQADPARVGVVGFSLGGGVALSLAGAIPDAAHFTAYCDTHWDDVASCANAPSGGGPVIEGAIGDAIKSDVTKPVTLKALVLLDPFAVVFDREGLAPVTMPVLVVRPAESALGATGNAWAVQEDLPSRPSYITIPGSHFVFTDVCSPALAAAEPDLCQDPPDMNRAAVHAFIAPRIVRFLQDALGGPAPPPAPPAPVVAPGAK